MCGIVGLAAVAFVTALPEADAQITCTFDFVDLAVPPISCPVPQVVAPGTTVEFRFREQSFEVSSGSGPCVPVSTPLAQCPQLFQLTKHNGLTSTPLFNGCLLGTGGGVVAGASGPFTLNAGDVLRWTLSPAVAGPCTVGSVPWGTARATTVKFAGVIVVPGTPQLLGFCGTGEVGAYVLEMGGCYDVFSCGPSFGRVPNFGNGGIGGGGSCECFRNEGGSQESRRCIPAMPCEGMGAEDPGSGGNRYFFVSICNGPDGLRVCVGTVEYGTGTTYTMNALCGGLWDDCIGVWEVSETGYFDTTTGTWTKVSDRKPVMVLATPLEVCP